MGKIRVLDSLFFQALVLHRFQASLLFLYQSSAMSCGTLNSTKFFKIQEPMPAQSMSLHLCLEGSGTIRLA